MSTFCISVKVEDEKDLYDRFLPSGLSFSSELTAYLENYLEERKLGESVSLELQASQEPDMEHFRSAYHAFREKLIQRNEKAIRQTDLNTIIFLIIGMAFVSVGLTLAGRVDAILAEIISAFGSFALWGAASSFIETLPTLRFKRKRLKKLSDAEIHYKAV